VTSGPASLGVKHGPISLLIANPRPTFDSAARFHCGKTTNLTFPAAIPADSLVYLGPNLVLARFTAELTLATGEPFRFRDVSGAELT